MKSINKHFFTSILLTLLTSCTSEYFDGIGQDGGKTIEKVVVTIPELEADASTRTEFSLTSSDGLSMALAKDDTLGIFPTKGDQVSFPMTGSGTTFTFDGGGWGLKDKYAYAAYFPFSKANYFRTNQTIVLDYQGQVQDGLDNPAHIGKYDFLAASASHPQGDYLQISLVRKVCVVRLYVTLPAPGTYTDVSIVTEDDSFIARQLLDISGDDPITTDDLKSDHLSLSLKNFKTTTADQHVRLFLMAAPVDMTGKTLTIYMKRDDGSIYKGTLTAVTEQVFKANAIRKFNATLTYYGEGDGGGEIPGFDDDDPVEDYTQLASTLSVAYEDEFYKSGDFVMTLDAEKMSSLIYDNAKVGGMTMQQFHEFYTDSNFDATNDENDFGSIELVNDNVGGEPVYAIKWTLPETEILQKYPIWSDMSFSNSITWTGKNGNTLDITFTKTISKPIFSLWGFNSLYWEESTPKWTVFKVSPDSFDTTEINANERTLNIYSDLLAGFQDDLGNKPVTGADGILYFTGGQSNKKYYYAADYGVEALNTWVNNVSQGERRAGIGQTYASYDKEGVRFSFDESKLNDGDHTYYYYDSTAGTHKKGYAYVVNNDGKEPELWISASKTDNTSFNQKAATIVNCEPNALNSEELTYNIKLEEANPSHAPWSDDQPTEAAKALVGKSVPVKLVADACGNSYTSVLVRSFNASITRPLTGPDLIAYDFIDSVDESSSIIVSSASLYSSWNRDANNVCYPVICPKSPDEVKELLRQELFGSDKMYPADYYDLALNLGNFYEVGAVEFDVQNITTNLKLDDNGNLVPTDGISNGPLPSNVQVSYNQSTQTLTYNNYSGTPVTEGYVIYIPVKSSCKWGIFAGNLAVKVVPKSNDDGSVVVPDPGVWN